MNKQTVTFNNNLLVFLVENQKYMDALACSKGGSDRQINTHREHNIELINWYKRGNAVEMPEPTAEPYKPLELGNSKPKVNKRKYEIPPVLKEKLREHEVEMVEYMLKIGFYSSNDLWLTGVQRSINTYCQTINENGLDERMEDVKACISRVKKALDEGKVKTNKQGYLQTSLSRLAKK
jgi:hypothetical protein